LQRSIGKVDADLECAIRGVRSRLPASRTFSSTGVCVLLGKQLATVTEGMGFRFAQPNDT